MFAFLLSLFILTSDPFLDLDFDVQDSESDVSGNDVTVIVEPSISSHDLSDILSMLDSIDLNLSAVEQVLAQDFYSYQLPDYYKAYFVGVLNNLGYTHYLAWSNRVYNGSTYVQHYYLMYDIELEQSSRVPVSGRYPVIDLYVSNSVLYRSDYEMTFPGIPSVGFADFGGLSALVDRSYLVYLPLFGSLLIVLAILFSRKGG